MIVCLASAPGLSVLMQITFFSNISSTTVLPIKAKLYFKLPWVRGMNGCCGYMYLGHMTKLPYTNMVETLLRRTESELNVTWNVAPSYILFSNDDPRF